MDILKLIEHDNMLKKLGDEEIALQAKLDELREELKIRGEVTPYIAQRSKEITKEVEDWNRRLDNLIG